MMMAFNTVTKLPKGIYNLMFSRKKQENFALCPIVAVSIYK